MHRTRVTNGWFLFISRLFCKFSLYKFGNFTIVLFSRKLLSERVVIINNNLSGLELNFQKKKKKKKRCILASGFWCSFITCWWILLNRQGKLRIFYKFSASLLPNDNNKRERGALQSRSLSEDTRWVVEWRCRKKSCWNVRFHILNKYHNSYLFDNQVA